MIPSNLVEACFRKVSSTENGLYCHILTLFYTPHFFSYCIHSTKPYILMVRLLEAILI